MSKTNDKPKVSAGTIKTAGRLMKYVTGPYKVQFIIVLICILMTSVSTIAVSRIRISASCIRQWLYWHVFLSWALLQVLSTTG